VKTKSRRKNSDAPRKSVPVPEIPTGERKPFSEGWTAPLPLSIFRRIIE
jgi:hypothetical protein